MRAKRQLGSLWPLSQVVKTPPFHGGGVGSNPAGVTKKRPANAGNALRWQLYEYRPEVRKCSFVRVGFAITICNCMAPSSNGLGGRPLTPIMWVRIPLGSPYLQSRVKMCSGRLDDKVMPKALIHELKQKVETISFRKGLDTNSVIAFPGSCRRDC